jgi:hypothetical protein
MKDEIVFHLIWAVACTLFGVYLGGQLVENFFDSLPAKIDALDKLNLLDDILADLRFLNKCVPEYKDYLKKEFLILHEKMALLPTRAELTNLLKKETYSVTPDVDDIVPPSYAFFPVALEIVRLVKRWTVSKLHRMRLCCS